jgi:hypothetical protein
MLKIRRKTMLTVGAVALACVLALAGAALAAGSLAPQLRSPRGGEAVKAGHVKLTVYVPDPGNVINGHIFLTVSDKRIVKRGVLKTPSHCGFRCNIGIAKRVKGSKHLYAYVDKFHFAGNWQDTPGAYYWQAYYYPNNGVVGILPSKVTSFRIVP